MIVSRETWQHFISFMFWWCICQKTHISSSSASNLVEFKNSEAWQEPALLFGIIFHFREVVCGVIVKDFDSLFIPGTHYPQITFWRPHTCFQWKLNARIFHTYLPAFQCLSIRFFYKIQDCILMLTSKSIIAHFCVKMTNFYAAFPASLSPCL